MVGVQLMHATLVGKVSTIAGEELYPLRAMELEQIFSGAAYFYNTQPCWVSRNPLIVQEKLLKTHPYIIFFRFNFFCKNYHWALSAANFSSKPTQT